MVNTPDAKEPFGVNMGQFEHEDVQYTLRGTLKLVPRGGVFCIEAFVQVLTNVRRKWTGQVHQKILPGVMPNALGALKAATAKAQWEMAHDMAPRLPPAVIDRIAVNARLVGSNMWSPYNERVRRHVDANGKTVALAEGDF